MSEKVNEFERVSDEVVLIDGKYYRLMTDDEVRKFIWQENNASGEAAQQSVQRTADNVRQDHCPKCGEYIAHVCLAE